eukprot:TRINITY_DN4542_c0_g2_i6.p2 TRINITY_DN4542_c0_g2~~TRINITY_DN4542_c0_g2_i6.p2  ORF type:complete len:385 (+),score=82.94 TRINITY_DN4542_c0_g2_i6:156-1310(+)
MDRPLDYEVKKLDGKNFHLVKFNIAGAKAHTAGNSNWINFEETEEKKQHKEYEDVPDCRVTLPKGKKKQADDETQAGEVSAVGTEKDKRHFVRKMGGEEYTHFISIPLNTEDFLKKMVSIKNKIVDINEEYKEYFVPVERMHMTILMLYLPDDETIRKAVDAFNEIKGEIKKVLSGGSLEVRPKKLGYFSGGESEEMSKARVLHLELEDDSAIKKIDQIVDLTIKHMLAKDVVKKDHLTHVYLHRSSGTYKLEKLHITMMKTKKSEKNKKGKRRNNNDFECFDAYPILTNLRDEHFGSVKVKTIELSSREAFRADGYYEDLSSIPLQNSLYIKLFIVVGSSVIFQNVRICSQYPSAHRSDMQFMLKRAKLIRTLMYSDLTSRPR